VLNDDAYVRGVVISEGHLADIGLRARSIARRAAPIARHPFRVDPHLFPVGVHLPAIWVDPQSIDRHLHPYSRLLFPVARRAMSIG